MKILFMGTPDFARESLKALYESGDLIVAAVTQPDKPKGRGYKLCPCAVKIYAEEKKIPVYQPDTLKGEEFSSLLKSLSPDLIVVVSYGKLLPENVLEFPKYGCINVHGSLLPKYRGAAPIQRAIINGESMTGITTMYMEKGLDTGDMLQKTEVEISDNDNFETLHDKLALCGAQTLLSTIKSLKAGTLSPSKQNDNEATYAAKIEKNDCLIDFSKTAREIFNLVRGLSPLPLAFTHTPDGKILKVVSCECATSDDTQVNAAPGTVISLDGGICVACEGGSVKILEVIPQGKGRMNAQDFVRGRKIFVGDIFK